MKSIIPRNGQIVIRRGVRADLEGRNRLGIYVPQEDLPVSWMGTVIAVAEDIKADFEEGDRVAFDQMLTREVRWQGKTLVMIHAEDVLAILL